MKEKINKFFSSPYYVVLVLIISLLCWNFRQAEVGYIFVVVIACIILGFGFDTEALFPVIFDAVFMCRDYISMDTIPPILYIAIGALVLLFIFSIVRDRPNIRNCKMKWSFLAIAVSSIISLINLKTNGQSSRYAMSCTPALFFLIYLFFSGTAKKSKSTFLCYCLIGAGLLVSAEFLIEGIELGKNFKEKIITLGWGGGNTVAIYTNIAIICCFYLNTIAKRFWKNLLCTTVLLFLTGCLVLTQCRTGYLAFFVCLVPCLLFSILKAERKNYVLTSYYVVATILIFSVLKFQNQISDMLELAFRDDMDDHGRFKMWAHALEGFTKHPLIGNGMFNVDIINNPDPNRLSVCHNFIVQCLYSFGLIGVVALGLFVFELGRIVKRNGFLIFNVFFIIILLSGVVHGILDNTFYMGVYTTILCCIISVTEHEKD